MQVKLGVKSWIKLIGYREGVKKKGGIGEGERRGRGGEREMWRKVLGT
jgi:hypothetical protein